MQVKRSFRTRPRKEQAGCPDVAAGLSARSSFVGRTPDSPAPALTNPACRLLVAQLLSEVRASRSRYAAATVEDPPDHQDGGEEGDELRQAETHHSLEVPAVRAGPPVVLDAALEVELTGVQRVAVWKGLDRFLPVLVDDAELELAGRKLARLVAQQVFASLEPEKHVIGALMVGGGSERVKRHRHHGRSR